MAEEKSAQPVELPYEEVQDDNLRYFLLPLLMVVFVSWYFVARYQGNWAEVDTNAFTNMIRVFQADGRLLPRGGEVYPHGYGYQAISTFILAFTGVDVDTLQQVLYPLIIPLMVFPVWVLYREITGSARGAAITTILLFTQPEFLFVIMRSSHEKFTRTFIILGLFLLARSLRLRERPKAFILHVLLFYLPLFAMTSGNVMLAISFLIAVNMALIFGLLQKQAEWSRERFIWVVKRIFKGKSQQKEKGGELLDSHVLQRFGYILITSAVGIYIFIFHVYPPARADIGLFEEMLNIERPAATASEPEKEVKLPEFDAYTYLQDGTDSLMKTIGKKHPDYFEAMHYVETLDDTIAQARNNGDTAELMAEREQILQQLDAFSQRVNEGTSFQELVFARYESGIDALLKTMEEDHPRYAEALAYQQEFENLKASWKHGYDQGQAQQIASFLTRINAFAFDSTQKMFIELVVPAKGGYSGFISFDWRHPWFFILLGMGSWVVLVASGLIWAWQALRWLWTGKILEPRAAWLIWLIYPAFAAQIVLSVIADTGGGGHGGNALQRILPSVSMFAVAIIGIALAQWKPPRRLAPFLWGGISVGIFCITMLSLFKATNEPVFRNKWTFFRPEEMSALVWGDTYLPEKASAWTEVEERLSVAFSIEHGRSGRSTDSRFIRYPSMYPLRKEDRNLVVSDLTRQRSSRIGYEIPLPPDAFQVYDNGGAQFYHVRPTTPHQE